MATAMAATVSTTLPLTNPSCSRARLSVCTYSAAALPSPRCARIHLLVSIPQPGSRHLCPWSGLKHLGVSWRHRSRGCKQRYIGRVHASLFGVGAPEALVIGVVALLVFGPKGLAEVARNLGKTLRAFQPTIRELQEVSREFKNTLEREIGLDEIPSSVSSASQSSSFVEENPQAVADPNGTLSTRPYSSEELLKVTEEQLAKPQSQETQLEDQPQGFTPSSSEEILKVTEELLAKPQSQETQLEDQPQGFTPSSSEELLKVTDKQWSASESEPRSQATQLEDQLQGVPDAHSSPEATDATSATQTASRVSASEVAAQTTLVENPENKASES